jgi:hypothetical protein
MQEAGSRFILRTSRTSKMIRLEANPHENLLDPSIAAA